MTALSEARRQHMQLRALERFGLQIGKADRRALIRKVQTGDVKFARKLTHSRTVVVTEYAEVEVTFIYSGRTKTILTFLPPDARETALWRHSQDTGLLAPVHSPEPVSSAMHTSSMGTGALTEHIRG